MSRSASAGLSRVGDRSGMGLQKGGGGRHGIPNSTVPVADFDLVSRPRDVDVNAENSSVGARSGALP